MILFELTDGLFDYVSGPGTTLVDGFITFEVLLSLRADNVNDTDVGQFRVTVQGLLKKGQPYRWMQYIQYPTVDEDLGPDSIFTKVTIIDFRCDSSCNLKIRHNGYQLLKNSDHWIAPITT